VAALLYSSGDKTEACLVQAEARWAAFCLLYERLYGRGAVTPNHRKIDRAFGQVRLLCALVVAPPISGSCIASRAAISAGLDMLPPHPR
jgi:hypothetical protein